MSISDSPRALPSWTAILVTIGDMEEVASRASAYLFGAAVDFMPQPDTKLDAMGGRTMPGLFVGYHTHAGGIWSGDYLADRDVGKAKSLVPRKW